VHPLGGDALCAREIVEKEFRPLWMVNNSFRIPTRDGFHRVVGVNRLDCDAVGVGLFAHMQLRGLDTSLFALYPEGRREALLVIPKYSLDRQMGCAWPLQKMKFPRGTVIEAVSHFDNSPFNPSNPDPGRDVTAGRQNVDEMPNGVLFYYDENEQLGLRIEPKNGKVLESESQSPTTIPPADRPGPPGEKRGDWRSTILLWVSMEVLDRVSKEP